MVVCKYFLQGTCRFGDNCKFEHQASNDHNYASSTSILLQNYGNKAQQTTTTNVDTNTLVKSVVTDMTSAEKGGQWLLSSYAPFKEKPAFPGFEDHSMEEIRYLFYEARKNGTVEQFKQNLQMILQQAIMKIKALQNPSPEAVNMLKSIYNTAPSSSFGNSQTPFTNTQTNSIFGNQQPQQNIFASPPPNQTVFAQQPNASSNIFASNQSTQQNVFRGSNNNSLFTGGQSNNIFTSQQPLANKSIFASPQPTANNAVFTNNSIFSGGTQPVFANQPQAPSPFTQSSPFNQQPQMTFTPPQQNIFQQSPSNQFAQLPNQNNQYPTQPTLENKPSSLQHSTSIFGNLAPQSNNPIFGGVPTPTQPDESFYSKLEELTEEEIKRFQSDDLDMTKIPEKPPTYEMCFKI